MNQEVLITERLCSGDSSRESSKELVAEVRHCGDNHCKAATLDANKKPDLETRDKFDECGKDHIQNKQIECMVDNTVNGIDGTEYDISLEVSTQNKRTEKKTKSRKSNKKREDAVHGFVLKEKESLVVWPDKDTSQKEVEIPLNSVGNAEKEAARDAITEDGSSDAMKQLISGVHDKNDLPQGNEASVQQANGNNDKLENGVVDVRLNNLLGETSEHKSHAKKKRKRLGSGVQKTDDLCEVSVTPVDSKNDNPKEGIVDVQCSNLLGDVANSGRCPPAKKKQKIEKNDSKKDAIEGMTTPEQSLREENKSKNAISDGLSAECREDIHSLRTSSSSGRKKKKSKSTNSHKAVAAILSPMRESREESARGVVGMGINHKDCRGPEATGTGENVLGGAITKVSSVALGEKQDGPVEEVAKRNLLGSLDVDIGDVNACNVATDTDVPEEPATSGVERMDASRSGQVDVKDLALSTAQEPNGLQVADELSRQESTVCDDHKRIGADQTGAIKEAREVHHNDDPKDRTPEAANSCKKTKKSQRTSGRTRAMSSNENAEGLITGIFSTEHKSMKGDDLSVKSKHAESILSPMDGNDLSKVKSDGISLAATDGKAGKGTPAAVTSLQQICQSQAGGGNEDGIRKRKTRKQQTHAATNLPEVHEKEKEEDVGFHNPVPSSEVKLVDVSSKKAKKRKSSKTHSFNPDLVSGTVDCSQVSSRVIKGGDKGRALEVDGKVNSHNGECIEEGNNQKEVSCESNKINFKDYFVDGQNEQEVKSTGEVTELNRSSLNSEHSKPLLQSQKKLLKACGNGNNFSKSNPVFEEVRNFNVHDASLFSIPMGKNNKANAQPTSSLESSKGSHRTKKSNKHQTHNDLRLKSTRKASGHYMGEVVNKTKPVKSLLATSGAIFKDDSSMDSGGDQARVDSDATTRTPDNLSSSDCSDGESDARSNSSQNGSYSSKGEGSGRKNSTRSHSGVPKSMTLDSILRSSSSYKKAKLIASQSQPDDAESQPVDFVPDSQAEA